MITAAFSAVLARALGGRLKRETPPLVAEGGGSEARAPGCPSGSPIRPPPSSSARSFL